MSAPWCSDCQCQAIPLEGSDGRQILLDPKGARFHKRKQPAFICRECDALLFEPWKPDADPDRTEPRRSNPL